MVQIDYKRDAALDFLRGFAILLVVFSHAYQVSLTETDSILNSIRSVHMPLMFFVSGIGLNYTFHRDILNPTGFIKKKVLRLMLPYFFWTTIHYIGMQIVLHYKITLSNYARALLFSDFWFLRHLFIMFLAIWIGMILCKAIHIKKDYLIPVVSILVYVMFCFVPFLRECISLWWYLWFVIGFYIFSYKPKINSNTKVIILFVMLLATGLYNLGILMEQIYCCIICVSLYVLSLNLRKGKLMSVISYCGTFSLPIYAIHWCLLYSIPFSIGVYTKFDSVIMSISSAFIITSIWLIMCAFLVFVLKRTSITRRIILGLK